MVIFIVSLSVLFTSSIVGMLIVEQSPGMWVPRGNLGVLLGLGASTVVLLGNGILLQRGLDSVRRGVVAQLPRLMVLASVLAVVFLVVQAGNWVLILTTAEGTLVTGGRPHGFFFVLTGLHALHVIGGLVPLFLTTRAALRGLYSADRHSGLLLCTMYWHFLDGVWLTSLAVILVAA